MILNEFRKYWQVLHPVWKGIIYTGLASLTFFAEQALNEETLNLRAEAIEAYKVYDMDKMSGISELVFRAPLREELVYRGPVFVFIFIAAFFLRKFSRAKLLKIGLYATAVVGMLVFNYFWAFTHYKRAYTIFALGIVWGYLVISTRNILYSLIFHSGCNAIATVGVTLIYQFSN